MLMSKAGREKLVKKIAAATAAGDSEYKCIPHFSKFYL